MSNRAGAVLAMLLSGCFVDSIGASDESGPASTGPGAGGQGTGADGPGAGQPSGGDSSSGGRSMGGAPSNGGAEPSGGRAEGGAGGEPQSCTEISLWGPGATPADDDYSDAQPVEVGVRFRSDVSGEIRAIRYYKGSQNTGTHVGHLWSSGGQLLASATFSGEGSSGWQQASFPSPVTIDANTTYVASYHAPDGYYAVDGDYFANGGVDSPPLHALQDGEDGPNGVYHYGSSAFPDQTYLSNNYWVDVVLCF